MINPALIPLRNPRELPRLDALDKEEWWDVARRVKPDMSREEFEADYAEMQEAKRRHFMNG